MIYTPAHRGALCISARLHLEDSISKFNAISGCIDDLLIIREAMANGTYDNHLHNVVNANEALQDLLGTNLPAPTNGDNNRTLSDEYIKHIDATMEGLIEQLGKIIDTLFNAFVSYLEDIIVTIKRYRIKIGKYSAKWQMNKTFLGTKKEFEALVITNYPYKDWEILVDESDKLSDALNKMRPEDVSKWMDDNKGVLNKTLAEFGITIDNGKIVRGAVKYQKVESTVKNLRWIHESMGSYFDKILHLLDETIKDLSAGKIVKQAYNTAKKEVAAAKGNATKEAVAAKDSLKLAVDIFKVHRDNVAGVARSFIMLVDTAVANNSKESDKK